MLHLLFTRLLAAAKRRHERSEAIRALSSLDDRLLRDIGHARCDIESSIRGIDRHQPGSAERAGRAVILPNGTLMDVSCCRSPRQA